MESVIPANKAAAINVNWLKYVDNLKLVKLKVKFHIQLIFVQ